jgi:transcriptional regulator with XRE-family HTH domain
MDMQTVNELLDQVKARHGIASDYKLAFYLNVSQGTVQNWRHERSLPDSKAVTRIANELGLDVDVLLMEVESQRAGNDFTKAAWARIAYRLQSGASQAALVTIVAMVSMSGFSPNAEATALVPSPTKYTSYKVTLRRALFQALRKAKAIMLALSMPPVLVGAR